MEAATEPVHPCAVNDPDQARVVLTELQPGSVARVTGSLCVPDPDDGLWLDITGLERLPTGPVITFGPSSPSGTTSPGCSIRARVLLPRSSRTRTRGWRSPRVRHLDRRAADHAELVVVRDLFQRIQVGGELDVLLTLVLARAVGAASPTSARHRITGFRRWLFTCLTESLWPRDRHARPPGQATPAAAEIHDKGAQR